MPLSASMSVASRRRIDRNHSPRYTARHHEGHEEHEEWEVFTFVTFVFFVV